MDTDTRINSEQIVSIPDLNGNIIMRFYYGFLNYDTVLQNIIIDDKLKGYPKLVNKFKNPEGVWFSLMFFQNITNNNISLIGFYYGTEKDNYLEISEKYRGSKLKEMNVTLSKGLCRQFSGFTFNQVLTQLNTDHIRLYNAVGTPGCICYAKAAYDYNLIPFDIFDNPIIPPSECIPSHNLIFQSY